jgi:formylmethanofuran dehydrogenase subunit E
MNESATKEEREEFWTIHRKKSQEILGKPAEALFTIKAVDMALPPKATIESSIPCARCGEPTMASKLVDQDGHTVCKDCLA